MPNREGAKARRGTDHDLEMIGKQCVDAAYQVHREMGPGLLEIVYEKCLKEELDLKGIRAEEQVLIPLYYKGRALNKDFRVDLLIEGAIILEIKSVETMHPVHEAQLISYLKLCDKKLGFLINFHVPTLKEGINRYVNGL